MIADELSSYLLDHRNCVSKNYYSLREEDERIFFHRIKLKSKKGSILMKVVEGFSSVQSHSHVQLFATSWTAACQASLYITNSQSLLRFVSIKSVIPSIHLIFCHTLLLLPSVFPSIRVFSTESLLCIRWPKY